MSHHFCRLCGNHYTIASPFPIVSYHEGEKQLLRFCSQECMAFIYPRAAAPIQIGDMFQSDWIAYDQPRLAVELDEYEETNQSFVSLQLEAERELYSDLGMDVENSMPFPDWVILHAHPHDKDTFLLVPYLVDEEEAKTAVRNDGKETCLLLPHEFKGVYLFPFQESRIWLLMGVSVWRHKRDLDASMRYMRMTDESLKDARKLLGKLMRAES